MTNELNNKPGPDKVPPRAPGVPVPPPPAARSMSPSAGARDNATVPKRALPTQKGVEGKGFPTHGQPIDPLDAAQRGASEVNESSATKAVGKGFMKGFIGGLSGRLPRKGAKEVDSLPPEDPRAVTLSQTRLLHSETMGRIASMRSMMNSIPQHEQVQWQKVIHEDEAQMYMLSLVDNDIERTLVTEGVMPGRFDLPTAEQDAQSFTAMPPHLLALSSVALRLRGMGGTPTLDWVSKVNHFPDVTPTVEDQGAGVGDRFDRFPELRSVEVSKGNAARFPELVTDTVDEGVQQPTQDNQYGH